MRKEIKFLEREFVTIKEKQVRGSEDLFAINT